MRKKRTMKRLLAQISTVLFQVVTVLERNRSTRAEDVGRNDRPVNCGWPAIGPEDLKSFWRFSASVKSESHERNHPEDDGWKQDCDDNRRASSGRCDCQRHKREEQSCGASSHSPLSQQPPERVAMLLLWERPAFWPSPRRCTRQPVSDVRRNCQRSDTGITKLKLCCRPKEDTLPSDAN